MAHGSFVPGHTAKFLVKIPGTSERPAPYLATVLAVNRGILTVPELNSDNGLACIRIHGKSAERGTYEYVFTSKQGDVVRHDIFELYNWTDTTGGTCKTGCFLSG